MSSSCLMKVRIIEPAIEVFPVNFINLALFLEGKWQHVKDTTSIGEGKMFSPGNLRATSDNPDYAKVCSVSPSHIIGFSGFFMRVMTYIVNRS